MESVEKKVGNQTIIVGMRSSYDSKLPVTLAPHHLHLKNFHKSGARDQMAMKQKPQIKQMITCSFLASGVIFVGCASILGPSVEAGRKASLTGDHEEVIHNLKPFADSKQGWVAGALGESLYATAKTDEDYREAMRQLKNADAAGYDAGDLIGKMYALGQGVQKDNLAAAKWFDRYYRATSIKPDWSLLSGPPSTGYAEERYQYANSIRLKRDTWVPLVAIKDMYGCCDDEIPAERIFSIHLNIYDLNEKRNPDDGDHHYFDESGRRIKTQLVVDGKVGWTKNYSFNAQNESVEVVSKKDGSTKTATRMSINNNRFLYEGGDGYYSQKCMYRKEGEYYLEECEKAWGSEKSDKIENNKYSAATGELVGWNNIEVKCEYQVDYSRICTRKIDGVVSRQTLYSPRGWFLSEVSYAYCENGAIEIVRLEEAAYDGEDSRGNWKKRTSTHKKSKVNNTCSKYMYKLGELPDSLDFHFSSVYERNIVYR